jgi:hypothetical protein
MSQKLQMGVGAQASSTRAKLIMALVDYVRAIDYVGHMIRYVLMYITYCVIIVTVNTNLILNLIIHLVVGTEI